MRRKRRKRLTRAWAEFQDRHDVSDEVIHLVRLMGVPPDRLEEMLTEVQTEVQQAQLPTADDRLREIHRRWHERAARRGASRASGDSPGPKDSAGKRRRDPDWARAKRLCRLNRTDVRMARELGLNPRKLVKNIPSASQPWKAPVKIWIRELYAKRRADESVP